MLDLLGLEESLSGNAVVLTVLSMSVRDRFLLRFVVIIDHFLFFLKCKLVLFLRCLVRLIVFYKISLHDFRCNVEHGNDCKAS